MAVAHATNIDPQASLDLARIFLDKGCDIDAYNHAGMTALHIAVMFNDPVMAKFLLDHGAAAKLPIHPLTGPGTRPRFDDGLDAYEFAIYLRDKAKRKQDTSAVIAVLQGK
jgi:hypothetical protein